MMTVHVLHAGDGYTYLTRQVAAMDHQPRRGEGLSDYYLANGNPVGRWVGSGRAAMVMNGLVSETQMKALFGQGRHPDADPMLAVAVGAGSTRADELAATRLGRPFPRFGRTHKVWRGRLETAYGDFKRAHCRRPERGPERDLVWVSSRLLKRSPSSQPATPF